MSGPAALGEGQRIRLPAGVMKSGHSAQTFKPYDPSQVLGDVSPTTPKPAKTPPTADDGPDHAGGDRGCRENYGASLLNALNSREAVPHRPHCNSGDTILN